jgi:hypothetical protein
MCKRILFGISSLFLLFILIFMLLTMGVGRDMRNNLVQMLLFSRHNNKYYTGGEIDEYTMQMDDRYYLLSIDMCILCTLQ